MKPITALSLLAVLLLAGCQPTAPDIWTAVPKSGTVDPFETLSPGPTPTGLSPTLDARLVSAAVEDLLLRLEDLPAEGKYYLPGSDWISPHHNSEVIQDMGVEAGTDYINATGRVDGWFVEYHRGTSKVRVPVDIYDNVMMFSSPEGAKIMMLQYEPQMQEKNGFQKRDSDLVIGDATNVYVKNDHGQIHYQVEFSYRNFAHRLIGIGRAEDVDRTFIDDLARLLLERLKNAALAGPQATP